MTVGDDMGRIWVYDVGEALAIPGQDEWSKFAHTLVDIKQNKIDQVIHWQRTCCSNYLSVSKILILSNSRQNAFKAAASSVFIRVATYEK